MKLVRPGTGLKYHSSGSGSRPTHSEVRTDGVSTPTATVTSAKASSLFRSRLSRPQSMAVAAMAGPITLRMSTLSSPLSDPPPPRMYA